ncbi:uncharacterized protein (DUF1330 family) [Thermosporothrix hazakensis]|jgi:uncharacterized protein (DUF1330 family)|uniref:Uncharacterized protein (DUF1330 family) n=2 Tax=Thermosporothrix TaxID=768650 RepID=A0A326UF84_THEHA|nr:DUF1330 domain-containing protein [Thermosporothrix hazakensis]PZW29273.1 uncharacterized protein (DUF1330 family) [Thermosporothrix hazakensis]BBH86203.1 hypothetical protein KTC_09540 [Thermosporothrix sp. COM3]GCE45375.1 hypothetical protein KTH_02440 [Thermosporothrix hazakensis]
MSVYFIVDVKITDPKAYEEYRKQVQPTLDLYGGKFLVRGGKTWTIEGDWDPERIVIAEFQDEQHFRAWYDSPEYSKVRAIRFSASTSRGILVQGIE